MAEQKLNNSATTTDGLDASKTISNVNPDATNAQLAQFGQKVTTLTDNTYGKTDRVITINCDTESGGGKQTPTLTLTQSSCTFAQLNTSNSAPVEIQLTTDSDGDIYIKYNGASGMAPIAISPTATQGTYYVSFYKATYSSNDLTAKPQTITFGVMETNTYKAAEVTFSITE